MRLDNINETQASDHLNLVRGLAAMAVLVGHVRALFFVNYASISKPSIFAKLSYFLSGLGHEAVMVFFVLSGYFIGTAVLRSATDDRFWSRYLTRRLTRLLVVLIPALCLGAFWDFAGIHIFGTDGIYGGNARCDGVIPWAVAHRLTWSTAVGNLAFLQGIYVPTFGSNGPLWSLNYEFWYYVLFPILLLAMFTLVRRLWLSIIYCFCGFAILLLITRPILTSFPIWLLGVLVALSVPYFRSCQSVLLGTTMLVHLGVLWLTRSHHLGGTVADYAVGASFSLVLFSLLTFRDRSLGTQYSRLAKAMAEFSYTLYLVHLPILVFLRAMLIANGERWQPDVQHVFFGVLLILSATAYAYAIANGTEFKTDMVRRSFENLLRLVGQLWGSDGRQARADFVNRVL